MRAKKNQKQVSIEEYIEAYCQEKRIRGRTAVYVSPKTHHQLKNVVRLFSEEHHTTTSSLADSILSRHFEAYKELLDVVEKEHLRELREWLNNIGKSENDEPEEQSDNAEEEEEL